MVDEVGAHDPLRRAVDLGRHDGARHRRAEVQLFDGVGHPALRREKEPRAHGHARRAVGQGGHQAAAAEEAAGADDQDAVAHGVDDLGQQERRRDAAGVPPALGALGDDGVDTPLSHLLGVAPRPHRGHDEEPGLLAPGDQGRVGGLGEARHPGAGLDHQLDALVDIGHVGTEVDPEGGRGPAPHLRDGARQLVEGHGGRGQDAEAARLARGRDQAGPGHPAHAGLHQWRADADPLAQLGAQRRV